MSEIASVIPIDQVKSIDELACRLAPDQRDDPAGLGQNIKRAIRYNIGATITCSIGFAANRHLAKIAGRIQKLDGMTIWHPDAMPAPLVRLPLQDVPGIGQSMYRRLGRARIVDIEALLATQPKQLRARWGNVTGERMWYALHGLRSSHQLRNAACSGTPVSCPPTSGASRMHGLLPVCC